MNIVQALTAQAERRPNQPAIVEYSSGQRRAIGYAELNHQAAAVAAMLRRDGLQHGDRVLVLIGMSVDLYVVLIAIFRLGAVATFLDPSAGRKHINRCCDIAHPVAMIGTPKAQWIRLISAGLRRIRRKYSTGFSILPAEKLFREILADASEIYPADGESPALLTFTSGSTGRPKAAVRTHGLLLAQHRALENAIELKGEEIDLATLPIFALANLASGLTTIIPDADLRRPGFVNAKRVLEQIAIEHPTRSTASPAFFQRLMDSDGSLEPLTKLKKIYTGGAPVFPVLLNRLERLLPSAEIVSVFGSTEAEPIAHIAWSDVMDDDKARMNTGEGLLAGKPVPEISLRIIPNLWGKALGPLTANEFDLMSLPPGQAGEIVVQGEHVLPGYLDGVGDEQSKIRVDNTVWHRTGDAGYLDLTGRLWLLGRAEARIVNQMGSVYPFAVECAASGFPGIRRSALIAHESLRVLAIELDDGAPADAASHLHDSLTNFSIDRVLVMRQIPIDRRHNAKVDYPALRKLLQDMI